MYTWILNQQKIGFSVSTADVVTRAQQILPNLNNGSRKLLHWWAYRFIKHHSLVFRRPTRIFQYAIEELEARRVEFVQSTMTLVQMNRTYEHYFVNMDETALYFDINHNCTVNEKGAKTVLVRRGSTPNKICTVCVAVGADGSKLPFFAIFKVSANGRIAKDLPSILPNGMYGCTQEKVWMDNHVMEIWEEKLWKPYVENVNNSVLSLDQMESHIHFNFIDSVHLFGTHVIEIPGCFTCVSEPCNTGIMKLLKIKFLELRQNWKVAEYFRLDGTGKILIPDRVQILEFLDIVWKHFPSQTVRNSFKKFGFTID